MKTVSLLVLALLCSLMVLALLGLTQPDEKTAMKIATIPDHKAPAYSKSGYDLTPLSQAKIDELAKKLKPDEREIILSKGTEPRFCGTLLDNHKEGVYVCKLCGLPLFASDAKFNSGTGWPSFFQPVDADHIRYEKDDS